MTDDKKSDAGTSFFPTIEGTTHECVPASKIRTKNFVYKRDFFVYNLKSSQIGGAIDGRRGKKVENANDRVLWNEPINANPIDSGDIT